MFLISSAVMHEQHDILLNSEDLCIINKKQESPAVARKNALQPIQFLL